MNEFLWMNMVLFDRSHQGLSIDIFNSRFPLYSRMMWFFSSKNGIFRFFKNFFPWNCRFFLLTIPKPLEYLFSNGVILIFLPPYSPMFNPIDLKKSSSPFSRNRGQRKRFRTNLFCSITQGFQISWLISAVSALRIQSNWIFHSKLWLISSFKKNREKNKKEF